jgi:hypothetical protein
VQVVKLKAFSKFDNTTEALAAAASITDSKLSKGEQDTGCKAAAQQPLVWAGQRQVWVRMLTAAACRLLQA